MVMVLELSTGVSFCGFVRAPIKPQARTNKTPTKHHASLVFCCGGVFCLFVQPNAPILGLVLSCPPHQQITQLCLRHSVPINHKLFKPSMFSDASRLARELLVWAHLSHSLVVLLARMTTKLLFAVAAVLALCGMFPPCAEYVNIKGSC